MDPGRPVAGASQPLLVVLSGPSGVGKDATLSQMKQTGCSYLFSVTATTRSKRPLERDGVDYIFLTEERFLEMVQRGEFLEWARVYGHTYGVPKTQVQTALAQGRDVIVKVDVQGAASIKKLVPEAVFIFLAPPDQRTLERRLIQRMTDSGGDLALRLQTAAEEMQALSWFDYVIVNEDGRLDETVAKTQAIITAEKCRVDPRTIKL